MIVRDNARNLGPRMGQFPQHARLKRTPLTYELQKYLHILGPMPKRSLETFVDLGLSDPEIGRYFAMPSEAVTKLRQIWQIDRTV